MSGCEIIAGGIVLAVVLAIFFPLIHAIWTIPDYPDSGSGPFIL